ncbi:hypothetical protein EDEG_02982 [Edhazardia aedis USNM 41457]|uniref:Uncharacterized protein n=1 Tax=Edhazardia aedis (strain USNM 41457) TaxID=1003232 RepID=J9D520_EDHAE|nr:hypothetical protein EDEG_02982 [Edhazardia aedis USNM 41457]|eukprot:EJW02624.1 hypothetical protein EDEG_02982 [Edhazardia aedis USNM 41457]
MPPQQQKPTEASFFSASRAKDIIKFIKNCNRTIKICCLFEVSSICALQILTEILKKEMVGYEVSFCYNVDLNTMFDVFIDLLPSLSDFKVSYDDSLKIFIGRNIFDCEKKVENGNPSEDSLYSENSADSASDFLENESEDEDENLRTTKKYSGTHSLAKDEKGHHSITACKKDDSFVLENLFASDEDSKENHENFTKKRHKKTEKNKFVVDSDHETFNFSKNDENTSTINSSYDENLQNKENIDRNQNKKNFNHRSQNKSTIKRKKYELRVIDSCYDISDNLQSILTLYEMSKSLNYLNNTIIWSVIIPTTIYFKDEIFAKNEEEEASTDSDYYEKEWKYTGPKKRINKISVFSSELRFHVRKLNVDKIDGILIKKQFYKPFIAHSTLLEALYRDFDLIQKYRKLTMKKIFSRLAKIGISIREANESFLSINSITKSQIEKSMDQKKFYQRTIGYGFHVTALENYFAMILELTSNKPIQSLISISGVCDLPKVKKFYGEIMDLIRNYNYKIKKVQDVGIVFISKKELKQYTRPEVVLKLVFDIICDLNQGFDIIVICEKFNEDQALVVCNTELYGDEIYRNTYVIHRKLLKQCIDRVLEKT